MYLDALSSDFDTIFFMFSPSLNFNRGTNQVGYIAVLRILCYTRPRVITPSVIGFGVMDIFNYLSVYLFDMCF